ncbi:hypothetical protein GA0115240_11146 [Streptomyces sp. DvalAA-14]|uniref:hypothetical protein n=1 Tax=unclassified Streptomyces TaxID=2593676 RepID=UPI00081B238A|nr:MULTISPECIES: hypothetical protein [unclassified Streptomyces]MYS19650.1 hypothetical protein [Streptomyces sp. SID4948]SCD49776.1 hypothetical protein GA0115240_11146 [Streptomyces sp. DvalAA-14]
MHTSRTAITVTAAIATAALLGAADTAAAADSAAPSTPASAPAKATAKAPTGDGARALCKRLPKTDARIDRALRRLNGPATVRGSIARLQKRVDNAAAKGDTAVETYLKDKLAFRTSLVPTLNHRSTDLAAVRTWCGTQSFAAKKSAK